MKKILFFMLALLSASTWSFGGSGIYVEFKITSDHVSGTVKTSCLDGNSRSDMDMEMNMGGNTRQMNNTTLIRKDAPNTVYMLNETSKTYTESDISKSHAVASDDEEYDITVLGKEKVNGYSCTHVKVTAKKSNLASDMWVSAEVSNYSEFAVVKSKYLGGKNLFSALNAKGAAGFVVRIKMNDPRAGDMQMDLVKAEKKDLSESLFSLDGYKKSAAGAPGGAGMPGGIDVEKLKSMTPEERQKYIQDIKSQYGK